MDKEGDAAEPATLHSAGKVTACPTLQEAVIAWYKVPAGEQEQATIRVAKAIYTASEIKRLRYGASGPHGPSAKPASIPVEKLDASNDE